MVIAHRTIKYVSDKGSGPGMDHEARQVPEAEVSQVQRAAAASVLGD